MNLGQICPAAIKDHQSEKPDRKSQLGGKAGQAFSREDKLWQEAGEF